MSKQIDVDKYKSLKDFKETLYPNLKKDINKKRSYKDITKYKLKKLINNKKLNKIELSKYFNCNRGTIYKRTKKWNIKNNSIKNRYKIFSNGVKVQLQYKNDSYITLIDKNSFYKIKNKNIKWSIHNNKNSNTMYVFCRNKKFNNKKPKSVLLHRLILDKNNKNSRKVIDHKNKIGLDNRKSNLRLVSKSVNAYNSMKTKNYSNYPGLHYSKKYDYWQPYIRVNRQTIYLGTYYSKKEAYKARKEAERKYLEEGAIYEQD